jgi:ABC-type nitrate/sulfonate/bicarbonate transport system permease component
MRIRFRLGNLAFLLVLLSVCEYLKGAAGEGPLWQASLLTMRRLFTGYIIGIAAQRRNEAEGLI